MTKTKHMNREQNARGSKVAYVGCVYHFETSHFAIYLVLLLMNTTNE